VLETELDEPLLEQRDELELDGREDRHETLAGVVIGTAALIALLPETATVLRRVTPALRKRVSFVHFWESCYSPDHCRFFIASTASWAPTRLR
jgi:hypothetical protein